MVVVVVSDMMHVHEPWFVMGVTTKKTVRTSRLPSSNLTSFFFFRFSTLVHPSVWSWFGVLLLLPCSMPSFTVAGRAKSSIFAFFADWKVPKTTSVFPRFIIGDLVRLPSDHGNKMGRCEKEWASNGELYF